MFNNKYSSFTCRASETIFVLDGIIGYKGVKALVFTDKILRYKVTSLDIYLQYSSMSKSITCMGEGQN